MVTHSREEDTMTKIAAKVQTLSQQGARRDRRRVRPDGCPDRCRDHRRRLAARQQPVDDVQQRRVAGLRRSLDVQAGGAGRHHTTWGGRSGMAGTGRGASAAERPVVLFPVSASPSTSSGRTSPRSSSTCARSSSVLGSVRHGSRLPAMSEVSRRVAVSKRELRRATRMPVGAGSLLAHPAWVQPSAQAVDGCHGRRSSALTLSESP